MSGQKNKKPSDVIKFRQEYLDNLSLQVQLNDANEQAVKQFVSTGQVPPISQMKDTRSTSQILLDVEKLKINLVKDLEPIADPQFAQQIIGQIVQSPLNIDNQLLIFTAQRVDEIVKNLKKLYKYGIKGDSNDAVAFVSFINKMFLDQKQMTQSIKSYMNRQGETPNGSSNKDVRKILTQSYADYTSTFNTLSIQLDRLLTTVPIPPAYAGNPMNLDIQGLINEINGLDYTIESKYKALLSIFPEYNEIGSRYREFSSGGVSQLDFLQSIENVIIDLQGSPNYNMYVDEFERYLYFINHNIPNLSYSQSILANISSMTNQINRDIRQGVITIRPEIFENVKNQLTAYNGLLDVDLVEIREIEAIYRRLKALGTNYFPPGGRPGGNPDNPGGYFPPPPGGNPPPPPPGGYLPPGYPDEYPPIEESESSLTVRPKRPIIRSREEPEPEPEETKEEPIIDERNLRGNIKTNNMHMSAFIRESPPETKQRLRDLIRQSKQALTDPQSSQRVLIQVRDEQRRLLRSLGAMGHGLKTDRKMSGRGLTRPDYTQGIEASPRYIKFGRYMINNKKLNDNILSLRRSKGSTIATIPATKMTSELGNVFKKIVGGGVPSYDELNSLTDAEKKYLYKVSQEADIYDKIKIPTPCKDEEEKDIHLFNVMKGEIMAGNNSKELVSKFKVLLNKLSRTNILPKSQVREILEELLELGF